MPYGATLKDYPGLNVVYEEVRNRVDQQLEQANAIDAKANLGIVSASLILGAIATLREAMSSPTFHPEKPLTPFSPFVSVGQASDWSIYAGMLCYVIVLFTSWRAYLIRGFKVIPPSGRNPFMLQTFLWETAYMTENEAKEELTIKRVDEDLVENQNSIECKLRWTRRSIRWVLIEGVLLLFMTFVSTRA